MKTVAAISIEVVQAVVQAVECNNPALTVNVLDILVEWENDIRIDEQNLMVEGVKKELLKGSEP